MIDLIGQLNRDIIGCKDSRWLVGFDPSIVKKFANCCCKVRTNQFEFANTSLPELYNLVCRVKTPLKRLANHIHTLLLKKTAGRFAMLAISSKRFIVLFL